MDSDFDQVIPRVGSGSVKWEHFGADVLPMWVADMDFKSPQPVIDALQARVQHGIFGYPPDSRRLRDAICEHLSRSHGWPVEAEWIVLVPGVVSAFNIAARALVKPGEGILIQTPVYFPMLEIAANFGLVQQKMQLDRDESGHYTVDVTRMADTVTALTRALVLCNPQNPTGRIFTSSELASMAEVCLRHDVAIISDEIHCDLTYRGNPHVPIASLDPEIASRTITLLAPSKTYNIPGLGCAFAVISDSELRRKFKAAAKDIVPHVNAFGQVAALAAYEHGDDWLAHCLTYLEANRDFLVDFVHRRMPGLSIKAPEATYLAWLNCRGAGLAEGPARFFLREAKVALNEGASFGPGGEGFVRLNFGCPRATLVEGLDRMCEALAQRR